MAMSKSIFQETTFLFEKENMEVENVSFFILFDCIDFEVKNKIV